MVGIWFVALGGCRDHSPIEVRVVPPDPVVPLVRTVVLDTPVDARVAAHWSIGDRPFSTLSPRGRTHQLDLIGLAPDTDHTVSLTMLPDGPPVPLPPLQIRTDPLPQPFPDRILHVGRPEGAEPGDTLVEFSSPGSASYAAIFDPEGTILWLYAGPDRLWGLHRTHRGTLMGLDPLGSAVEITVLGQQVGRWSGAWGHGGTPVAAGALHHEIALLGDDTLLSLVHDVVEVDDFRVDYTDPDVLQTADVLVDRAVRLAADGTIVAEVSLLDVLPPERIGFQSLNRLHGGFDWTHANGVAVDPVDDDWVISARHVDTVFKVDPDTGEVAWLLANPTHWPADDEALRLKPVGEVLWPYHQHAPSFGPSGELILFDNGNHRATPGTGEVRLESDEAWSRVVAFDIDAARREIRQAWSFEPDGQRLFSGAEGDADWLPTTGHVLSLWGYVTHTDGVPNADRGLGDLSVRIIEFDPSTGQIHLDLELSSPADQVPAGWNSYRVERLAPLTGSW